MRETYWLEDFEETCRDITEDACLLEALAMYADGGAQDQYFPQALRRLCNYLSQHASDLRCLEKRLGPQ